MKIILNSCCDKNNFLHFQIFFQSFSQGKPRQSVDLSKRE